MTIPNIRSLDPNTFVSDSVSSFSIPFRLYLHDISCYFMCPYGFANVPLVFGVNNFPNGLRLVWQKLCVFFILWSIWVFPKIGGKPPKWMVKIMENPIRMDDLGGKPTIFGNIQILKGEVPHVTLTYGSHVRPPEGRKTWIGNVYRCGMPRRNILTTIKENEFQSEWVLTKSVKSKSNRFWTWPKKNCPSKALRTLNFEQLHNFLRLAIYIGGWFGNSHQASAKKEWDVHGIAWMPLAASRMAAHSSVPQWSPKKKFTDLALNFGRVPWFFGKKIFES